jgi:hypothetical protein
MTDDAVSNKSVYHSEDRIAYWHERVAEAQGKGLNYLEVTEEEASELFRRYFPAGRSPFPKGWAGANVVEPIRPEGSGLREGIRNPGLGPSPRQEANS